jgi:hypothetical protein
MENVPVSARTMFRWLLPSILALNCAVAWLTFRAGSSAPAARVLTWILSTEILPPALIAGAAWLVHLKWRSHHSWRQQQ